MIEARGRTGRKPTAAEKGTRPRGGGAAAPARERRARTATTRRRPGRAAVVRGRDRGGGRLRGLDAPAQASTRAPPANLVLVPIVLAVYMPLIYYTDLLHVPPRSSARRPAADGRSTSARFTVGPFQRELLHRPRARARERALLIDPGDEAERLIEAIDALGVTIEAILLTHTHIDHIGAVARARARTPARPSTARRSSARCSPTSTASYGRSGSAVVRELRGRRAARAAASSSSSPGLEIDVALHARAQPRPPDLRDPGARDAARRRRPLPRLGRARRPAGRRLADAARLDRAPARRLPAADARLPGSRPAHDARARARHQPVSRPSSPRGEPRHRPARDLRHPARAGARARRARAAPRASCSRPPATAASRRRPSRRPSCSRAASARRPTSSRRRCTASTTAAGAR